MSCGKAKETHKKEEKPAIIETSQTEEKKEPAKIIRPARPVNKFKPKNKFKPNQTNLNQTKPNQIKSAESEKINTTAKDEKPKPKKFKKFYPKKKKPAETKVS